MYMFDCPCVLNKISAEKNPEMSHSWMGAGGRRHAVQNFLNFLMQFLENFGKIMCWRPPGELESPPTGILDPPLTVCLYCKNYA